MKKLILVLVLIAMVMPAFADDAKVLPKGVIRARIAPNYTTFDTTYDEDGNDTDVGANSIFGIAAALEYGITDWINAAIQFTPGYAITGSSENDDNLVYKGASGAFMGAKVQVVGEDAPVMNENVRFAVAAGALVPMAFSYDAESAAEDYAAGEEYQYFPYTSAFGLGGRVYADYVLNEMFFFNLYSEYQYRFPIKKEKTDVETYSALATSPPFGYGEDEIDPGYKLTLEAEPHFEYPVADGVQMGVGVPITYVMTPNVTIGDTEIENSASTTLSIGPNVSFMFTNLPFPVEIEPAYNLFLSGTNTANQNTMSMQIKSYLKF